MHMKNGFCQISCLHCSIFWYIMSHSSFLVAVIQILSLNTVLPALRANSCIDFDRLMIELLDFHIPFSFTNAGFKGYGKNLLNRRLRITLLP